MPIIIPTGLPAKETLDKENIFTITEDKAQTQDIRPINILILNLMPTKVETETQLIRLLSNTPLQTSITLLKTNTYSSKNTKKEHLDDFYKTFEDIKHLKYDGLIITGAPVETLEFKEVLYWRELTEIMEYSKTNVTSTLHICWGSQAGLFYHYGIEKYPIENGKLSGVFPHNNLNNKSELLRGFDSSFYAPHSRYTENKLEDIKKVKDLEVLAYSKEAGVLLVASKNRKQVFISGHLEYDEETLKNEYLRDLEIDSNFKPPLNYFEDNNPNSKIIVKWKSHSYLLFSNWINYYVYQMTPFELD